LRIWRGLRANHRRAPSSSTTGGVTTNLPPTAREHPPWCSRNYGRFNPPQAGHQNCLNRAMGNINGFGCRRKVGWGGRQGRGPVEIRGNLTRPQAGRSSAGSRQRVADRRAIFGAETAPVHARRADRHSTPRLRDHMRGRAQSTHRPSWVDDDVDYYVTHDQMEPAVGWPIGSPSCIRACLQGSSARPDEIYNHRSNGVGGRLRGEPAAENILDTAPMGGTRERAIVRLGASSCPSR